jgi:5-(carboxyamino)imidazole ribonucleotide synthase
MIENIGVVGGGQLGRMLTESAIPLGFSVTVVDPAYNCPARQIGANQILAALDDPVALDLLAERSDVVTWEIEHFPANHLGELAAAGVNVEPSAETLAIIQDKLVQKELLRSEGIPVAPFSAELDESRFLGGGPFIVKTRKGGYDGRGNLVVDTLEPAHISQHFGVKPVYVEQKVEFEKELSVIAARDTRGNIKTYPIVETIHKDNICHTVISPAEIDPKIAESAQDIAEATMEILQGAGVFAIEMFVVNGAVLVNEIAPRVHNSGHHTIEANATSQFEQHIRAITGMPLGDTRMIVPAAVMINILGTENGRLDRTGLDTVLALPDTHPHFYGKDPRRARKIGHITVTAATTQEAKEIALKARRELQV